MTKCTRLFELLLEQRLALLERHRRLGRQFQSLLPSEGEQVRQGQHPVGEPRRSASSPSMASASSNSSAALR